MYHGERLNAWTHLVGAVAAFVGGVWLLVIASMDGSPWKIVSVAIYAFTLLVLYSASTVYHSVRGRKKAIMQKVDHFSIYLLIAGSYTPFCLVTLRGPWGWTLFGIVWGLALIGILQEIKPRSEARILSIVIYAVMGWIVTDRYRGQATLLQGIASRRSPSGAQAIQLRLRPSAEHLQQVAQGVRWRFVGAGHCVQGDW
jgi:hemolysin III